MKTKHILIFLVGVMALTTIPGCVYFQLSSTPSPVPTVTPSPINPNFIPPTTSNNQTLPEVPDFVPVIASVRPSVVAINVTIPSLDIFGGTLNLQGAGSGWVIDEGGLIITNNHVVEGANNITVTLEDGRNFPAELVRTDPMSDLAVVKINASNLKAVKVGDSANLKVGDWVVAMGNSLGQGISATKGIVSALGISMSVGAGQTLYDLIQTDAAINEGNSGGPLVNLLGEVVGITSIKISQVGVEGMGYAISTKEALPIIYDLIRVGYASHPWIGASLYTVDQIVVLRYGLAVNQGALVTQIASGGPADKAGIQAGDVITAIEGRDVATVDDLNNIIHGYKIGQQVNITYYHGDTKNTVSITLAPSPPTGP